jgi:hypothetical protein
MEILLESAQDEWFMDQLATWNGKYQVNFSRALTMYGIAFSFNLVDSKKLYMTNR